MKISRTGIAISVLPGFLMVAFFYSLAAHMYLRFGGWPLRLASMGSPPALTAHATVAVTFCTGLGLFTAFGLPVAALVCLLVRKWRRVVPYFILNALMFFASLGLMKLAPQRFLDWW